MKVFFQVLLGNFFNLFFFLKGNFVLGGGD